MDSINSRLETLLIRRVRRLAWRNRTMNCFAATTRRRLDKGKAIAIAVLALLGVAALLVLFENRASAVGSDEILFRKHAIDLGSSESCAVADVNQDGSLDIVSGENWYEQAPPLSRSEGS